MNTKTHVFIGFTPLHRTIIKAIANSLQTNNILYFHPNGIELPLHYGELGLCNKKIPKFVKYLLAAKQIKIILKKENTIYYIPHALNPLTNHIFFHPSTPDICVYSDGIANYYDANTELFSTAWHNKKRLIAKLIGLENTTFKGHITATNIRKAKCGYFFHPENIAHINHYEKTIPLENLLKINLITPIKGRILLLDQPLERLKERDGEYLKASILEHLLNLGSEIYYKPHHDQTTKSIDTTIYNIKTINSKDSAEELIPIIKPQYVISFFSSALINIKLLHPNIECYFFGADLLQLPKNNKQTKLSEIMKEFGVKDLNP